MMAALPGGKVADIFVDLASRTGVDLGEVAERVFDRLGKLAARAGDEASYMAQCDAALQLRDLAARAAGRAAELAYRTGAERLLDAVPAGRKRPRGRFLLFGALAALTVAGAAGYMVASRREEERRRRLAAGPSTTTVAAGDGTIKPADGEGVRLSQIPSAAAERVRTPVNNLLGGLRRRLQLARGEARTAQAQTEVELWRKYADEVYPSNGGKARSSALPYGPRDGC